jgi:hypothetical protein
MRVLDSKPVKVERFAWFKRFAKSKAGENCELAFMVLGMVSGAFCLFAATVLVLCWVADKLGS